MTDEQKINIRETFEEILKRLDIIEEKIKAENTFQVESLDPNERSWYYEGDGTKRKKSE